MCVGVFKMLIYVQKISERIQPPKKKIIVFSLQGRERVWYTGHFYLFFHFTHSLLSFSMSMYYFSN